MTQQEPVVRVTAAVLKMESDLKILKTTVYLLKVLIGTQLFSSLTELESFLKRFSEAERGFDPDKQTLDAALRALKLGTPISEA